jgi:hypothetical protein
LQGAIFAVFAILLAVYGAVIWLPLNAIAVHERRTYDTIKEGHKTSFRRNLRRRGSYGHLDFLGVEERRHLLLSTGAPTGGKGGSLGSGVGFGGRAGR